MLTQPLSMQTAWSIILGSSSPNWLALFSCTVSSCSKDRELQGIACLPAMLTAHTHNDCASSQTPRWSRSCSSTYTLHEPTMAALCTTRQKVSEGFSFTELKISTKGSIFGSLNYCLFLSLCFILLSLHCWLHRAVPNRRSAGAMPITRGQWMFSLPIDLTGIWDHSGTYCEGFQVCTSYLRRASQTKHQIQRKDNNISDHQSPEKPQQCLNNLKN